MTWTIRPVLIILLMTLHCRVPITLPAQCRDTHPDLKANKPEDSVSLPDTSGRFYSVKDEYGRGEARISVDSVLKNARIKRGKISISTDNFVNQMTDVLAYLTRNRRDIALYTGLFSAYGITMKDIRITLQFIIEVMRADMESGSKLRMQDPGFINKNFWVFRWLPDSKAKGISQRFMNEAAKIKITRYAVYTVAGSHTRSDRFRYALYDLPDDEKGLSETEANKRRKTLIRFRLTKQQVLAGAYDLGGARPLVWLSRDAMEKALMQGTICVRFASGREKFFNVYRSNHIPFDPLIKDHKNQRRYWYFTEVNQPKGFGGDHASKISLYPDACFAGDVRNLGLGKIMVLGFENEKSGRYQMRIGVMADSGGAFTPNLNQLDYYMGIVNSEREFRRRSRRLPDFAELFILIKK